MTCHPSTGIILTSLKPLSAFQFKYSALVSAQFGSEPGVSENDEIKTTYLALKQIESNIS